MGLAHAIGYGIGAVWYSTTVALRRLGHTTSGSEDTAAIHVPADPWEGTRSASGWLPTREPQRQHTGRLRARTEGDWNDQVYAWMDMQDGAGKRFELVLEVRHHTGKLARYESHSSVDSAHATIKRLGTRCLWRLIDKNGNLVGWDTRCK